MRWGQKSLKKEGGEPGCVWAGEGAPVRRHNVNTEGEGRGEVCFYIPAAAQFLFRRTRLPNSKTFSSPLPLVAQDE